MAERLSQRNADAARLRAEGWTYQRIADELGFANSSGAHKCVQAALRAMVREPTEVAVHLELTGLNEMSRAAWAVLRRDHVIVSQGKVVTLDGKPVPDDGPILAAIDRLLKVQERRARLLGLDPPRRAVSRSSPKTWWTRRSGGLRTSLPVESRTPSGLTPDNARDTR